MYRRLALYRMMTTSKSMAWCGTTAEFTALCSAHTLSAMEWGFYKYFISDLLPASKLQMILRVSVPASPENALKIERKNLN